MKTIKEILNPPSLHPNTDSPIEEILYKEFEKYGILPVIQHKVLNFRLDLAFPEIKLAIEADGEEFHSTGEQINNDIGREVKLEEMGWKIVRFTGSEIHRNYELIVAKILLQNFEDRLSAELKQRAIGRIVSYFTKKDPKFAEELTETAIKGYIYKK